MEAFRTAPCLDDYKQLMAYDESTGAKLHQMLLDLVFPPRKPKLATHLTPTLVLVAEHDFLTHSDHDSMTSLIALLLGLPRAEFACAAADAARLTLSAALAFERSRHRLLNLTLKPELRSAIKAIHAARDIEFHRLSEVLDNLDDEEERLLSMQLPEVKLGEPGWKVKEALRRELEKKQEEALDSFAEALEGDEDERKSWALAGPEPQEGWAARFGVGEERKPKMEDRQLGNRLLLWLDVLRQWPDAEQVAQLGEDFWRSTGMWTGVLESKPVVELLVSLCVVSVLLDRLPLADVSVLTRAGSGRVARGMIPRPRICGMACGC